MSRARRWAVGSVGAIATLLAVSVAPSADAADGEWEMLRWGIEPGDAVIGESWTIAGTISSPGAAYTVTDIEIILTRVDQVPGCPDFAQSFHVADGDDLPVDPDGTTTTTTTDPSVSSTTSTSRPGRPDEYRFRIPVVPRCNGRYHLSVVGTADGVGTIEDSVSAPLPLGDPSDPDQSVKVGLAPPDVTGTSAAADGRSVTVSWQPPAAYAPEAGGPPADLVGYVIEYSYDEGATWHGLVAVGPATYTATRTLPGGDPAGNYQFRVRGARDTPNADLPALAAGGATAYSGVVAIGAAPPPPATPTTRRPSQGGGRGGPSQGPTTTFDEGFSETIDYSELLEEGEDEPTLPDDAASFLDFIPERTGSAVLVPFAIAECLAVWALHLRYLARRVDGG